MKAYGDRLGLSAPPGEEFDLDALREHMREVASVLEEAGLDTTDLLGKIDTAQDPEDFRDILNDVRDLAQSSSSLLPPPVLLLGPPLPVEGLKAILQMELTTLGRELDLDLTTYTEMITAAETAAELVDAIAEIERSGLLSLEDDTPATVLADLERSIAVARDLGVSPPPPDDLPETIDDLSTIDPFILPLSATLRALPSDPPLSPEEATPVFEDFLTEVEQSEGAILRRGIEQQTFSSILSKLQSSLSDVTDPATLKVFLTTLQESETSLLPVPTTDAGAALSPFTEVQQIRTELDELLLHLTPAAPEDPTLEQRLGTLRLDLATIQSTADLRRWFATATDLSLYLNRALPEPTLSSLVKEGHALLSALSTHLERFDDTAGGRVERLRSTIADLEQRLGELSSLEDLRSWLGDARTLLLSVPPAPQAALPLPLSCVA